jgi:hypothetical protein
MPIIITDSDNICSVHTASRLQINLDIAKEIVEEMVMEVFFTIETQLPNGRTVGQPYWDIEPLRLTCKGNPTLTEAMRVIQEAIGMQRYLQLTTPKPIEEFKEPFIS